MSRLLTVVLITLALVQPETKLSAQQRSVNQLTGKQCASDFDQFWNEIGHHYAYFSKKKTSWRRVREIYRPRAWECHTKLELLHVLEDAIAELADDHATMGADGPNSPRIVPSKTDLWPSWHGDAALLDEVRMNSAAASAGLKAGDRIISMNGRTIEQAVEAEHPKSWTSYDEYVRDWALRRALAGRRGQPRTITYSRVGGTEKTVEISEQQSSDKDLLESRQVAVGIGYIRLQNSLGNTELISAFDEALAKLKNTQALILDLRDTASGGNNDVAEPILGRFIEQEQGYQRFEVPGSGIHRTRRFVQKVKPRGPFTYKGKLIVLADHWTASMGEGMATGLSGMKRAMVVGTKMAGLNGAVYTRQLRYSQLSYNYPAERIYCLDGTPREDFTPEVVVSLNDGNTADPMLQRAITLAQAR